MTDQLPLRPWNYNDLKRDYTYLLSGKKIYFRGHDFVFNRHLSKNIKKKNADIVILAGSWTYPTVLKMAFLKKYYLDKDTKLMFWYESHDNAAGEFKAKSMSGGMITRFKTKFMNCFDGFCVPGDLAKQSVSKFVSDKPFVYLRNAVDGAYYKKANELRCGRSALRDKFSIPQDTTAIIVPARLIKLKGIDELFSRFSNELISKYNFEFVFAGEGDQKEEIKKIADKKGIKTLFLGYQSQSDIRELLAACDFFCLSSLTDANPLSAIEAAWAGLPLIMSKYTGNYPELIEDGKNGRVFDTLDANSVNSVFGEMLSKDKKWREEASLISLKIAEEKFDVNVIANYLLEQLEEIKV